MPDYLCCRIDENRKLAVGEDLMDRMFGPIGMVYRCYNWEGTVAYQEYACGFRNTPPCTIPAKPYTPAEIEVFAQKGKPFA
ncbi:hypothetical protein AAVH_24689 [Aphelenchoides avenae]|nr:hypothetical protein AAVH_24689 [Aphelenchus avenae]